MVRGRFIIKKTTRKKITATNNSTMKMSSKMQNTQGADTGNSIEPGTAISCSWDSVPDKYGIKKVYELAITSDIICIKQGRARPN